MAGALQLGKGTGRLFEIIIATGMDKPYGWINETDSIEIVIRLKIMNGL